MTGKNLQEPIFEYSIAYPMSIIEQSSTKIQGATGKTPQFKYASAPEWDKYSGKPAPNAEAIASAIDKVPSGWALTPIQDKAPYRHEWQLEEPVSRADIKQLILKGHKPKHWEQEKHSIDWIHDSGYGLRTGDVSGGLLAVDIDGNSLETDAEKLLQHMSGGHIPHTIQWTSGKPGRRQLLFQIPDEYRERLREFTNQAINEWSGFHSQDKIDFRYNRKHSGLAGSRHPETGFYRWIVAPAEDGANVAVAPDWLLKVVCALADGEKEENERRERSQHKAQEQRERRKRQRRNGFTGANSILDIQDESIERLTTEELFNWQGHNFKTVRKRNRTEMWGVCPAPEHPISSGMSFQVRLDTNQWLCRGCGCGGHVLQYRNFLRGARGKSPTPRGRDYIEIVLELAEQADIEVPEKLLPKSYREPKKSRKQKRDEFNSELERLRSKRSKIPPRAYKQGERLNTWANSEKQFVVDSSSTGTGKSYDAGMASCELFDVAGITYITSDPRNVATTTLKSWALVNGRNKGLEKDNHGNWRTTEDEKFPSDQSGNVKPGNCGRVNLINALKNSNRIESPMDVCMACPFYGDCSGKDAKGISSYDYLKKREWALKQPRNISNQNSLPIEYDWGNRFLIWEEWSKILTNSSQIEVRPKDITGTEKVFRRHNKDLFTLFEPLLFQVDEILAGNVEPPSRYGWNHQSLKEYLISKLPSEIDWDGLKKLFDSDNSDESLQNLINFEESDEEKLELLKEWGKLWFLPFLKILSGSEPGYLYLKNKALTITQLSEHLVDIANKAHKNVFLDATGHIEELCALLNISADEVDHIAQEEPEKAQVNITQVADLGRMTQQRGKQQQKRSKAVIDQILSERDHVGVIRFKRIADIEEDKQAFRWFIESRGSNQLEKLTTLILDGIPCPNLEQLKADFTCLYHRVPGDDNGEFKLFVDGRILTEIHQAIGRLRASRRAGEQLEVIILGDYPLDTPVKEVKTSEITSEITHKSDSVAEKVKEATARLKSKGQNSSQRALARESGLHRTQIARHFKTVTSPQNCCNPHQQGKTVNDFADTTPFYNNNANVSTKSEAKNQSQREIQKDRNQVCNRPDLVASFKKAVVAIREKGGNITKVQVARELGSSRKHVSENREALQQAVEELQAESPPPQFEANEEAEYRLEGGDGQFDHYAVVISKPLHWVPSKGWLYLVGKVGTTQMRKVLEKDLKGTKNVQSGKTKKRSN